MNDKKIFLVPEDLIEELVWRAENTLEEKNTPVHVTIDKIKESPKIDNALEEKIINEVEEEPQIFEPKDVVKFVFQKLKEEVENG